MKNIFILNNNLFNRDSIIDMSIIFLLFFLSISKRLNLNNTRKVHQIEKKNSGLWIIKIDFLSDISDIKIFSSILLPHKRKRPVDHFVLIKYSMLDPKRF